MTITAHNAEPVPHSIATFIAEGGTPADLAPDARLGLIDVLRGIGDVVVDLEQEDPEDVAPLMEAIANPGPARSWWDQWDLELTCAPLLRATVEDMLSLELL